MNTNLLRRIINMSVVGGRELGSRIGLVSEEEITGGNAKIHEFVHISSEDTLSLTLILRTMDNIER